VLGENIVSETFVFRPVYSTNLDLTSADAVWRASVRPNHRYRWRAVKRWRASRAALGIIRSNEIHDQGGLSREKISRTASDIV
jgi:hypothetical protein